VLVGSCTSAHRSIDLEAGLDTPVHVAIAETTVLESSAVPEHGRALSLRHSVAQYSVAQYSVAQYSVTQDSVTQDSLAMLSLDAADVPDWMDMPAAAEPEAVPGADLDSPDFRFQRNDSLEVHGSLWFYFGTKFMSDSSFWSPIDEPTIGGFEVMYEFVKEFPFEVEFGFQYATTESEDSGTSIREEIETFEIYAGLRKSWDINFFATSLYVGTGIAYNWVQANLQDGAGDTVSAKDANVGVYLHTGFFIPLGTYLVAGVDGRGMLAGNYSLGQNTVSGSYLQATIFAGFAW